MRYFSKPHLIPVNVTAAARKFCARRLFIFKILQFAKGKQCYPHMLNMFFRRKYPPAITTTLNTKNVIINIAIPLPAFANLCGLPLRFACAAQADKAAFISVPQNGHIFVPSLSCSLHFGHNIINSSRYMRTVPLNCHGIPKRTSDMSKYQHRAHNGNYTEYQP